MTRPWHIKDQVLQIGARTLIMGVLNITPDSFSDGTLFFSPDKALDHADEMIAQGADIIDVGGESTRPGSEPVSIEQELERVVPIISELAKKTRIPISVDTTKSQVARAAVAAGASIINDVSALRFDLHLADVAAEESTGLILMHSRGTPATMHREPPVADIMAEVTRSLKRSIKMAEERGVKRERIVIDPGIGFGKTQEQNLELIAKLDQLIAMFPDLPLLIGTSRKSFIGRILMDATGYPAAVEDRLQGTMASMAVAVIRGAGIARVHDVKPAVETIRTIDAIKAAARM